MVIETRRDTRTEYIARLREVGRADAGRVGAKAANLGEMAKSDFPVPDGFVVTVGGFGRFLAANGLDPRSPAEAVAAAPIPDDLADAVRAATGALGDVPLAVRSSGVAEDLPGASFAGQYESVLDVRGNEAVLAALRRCWASAFSRRVLEYRAAQRIDGAPGMAVLVQQLVPADAAGVAFTANPVSGDRAEAVVSAVRGLGERLVSGEASPDEWLVRGEEAVCRSAPEGAVGSGEVLAVADLARRVEAYFGAPQDIEWAIQDGKLYLLQARPITTLPDASPRLVPLPVVPPPGFWERESDHFPLPLSPLFRSAFLPRHVAGIKAAFDEISMLAEGLDFREIGGWVYQRLVPPGGKDRPAPPAWLMPILIRLVPQMRNRVNGMVRFARSDGFGSAMERWHQEWRPGQIERISRLAAVELGALSDDELRRYLEAVISFLGDSLRVHALVSAADFMVAELAFTCRDLLGWDDRRTLDLLGGLSEQTSAPSRRLAGLALMARERPAVRGLLERIDASTASRLVSVDPEFAAAFDAYQREFGLRPVTFDVLEPTLLERPELALGLIRDQIARGYDPEADAEALRQRRAAVLAEARVALASRPAGDRERFERALARAERAYPIREDHELCVTNAPLALLRYATLELGARLVQRGRIATRDDVFFLEIEEALGALGGAVELRTTVERRRGERAWALAHPGPASYGKAPGPPPSIAALPPEARRIMESLIWFLDRMSGQQGQREHAAGATTITGIAASSGRYTGPVRVILNENEFGKLQAGDILVCTTTSPVWSVLFSSVGALVTNSGGLLSHPAIIAREYRIPAVVATVNGTRLLHDGQIVTVDGDGGTVEVRS
jgi:rifampicin phosphotransferase